MREKRPCNRSHRSAGVSQQQHQQVLAPVYLHFSQARLSCAVTGLIIPNFQVQCNAVYTPGAMNRPPTLIEKCDWHVFIVRRSVT